MATDRSQQVITLASVNLLNNPELNGSDKKKPVIWKEFGSFLDKRIDIQPNLELLNNSGIKSNLIINSSENSSYLSTNINYKVCKSCSRPIGEKSLSSHYQKCLEMRTKLVKDEQNDNTQPNNSIGKRKRGRNTVLEVESSSMNSTRNNTPVPAPAATNNSAEPTSTSGMYSQPDNNSSKELSNGTSKPKKKYKKSQAQKEKEAANAAAAASLVGKKDVKKKRQVLQKPKTATKPKGPLDVEKQCGVPLPSGGFCARSLTCKTHSMGAKRAVPGRSAPYDILLQQYQKRNQAKIAANNALAVQRQENAEFRDGDVDINGMNYNKVYDPDEETHLVLEGLSKNNPMPLERKIILPVRNRHRFLAMREAYANALIITGNSNQNQVKSASGTESLSSEQTLANQAISGSIGGLQGRCALINVDMSLMSSNVTTQAYSAIPGEIYQVRAPSKAINMTSQYNQLQQNAFQQQLQKYQLQQQQQQQQMALMRQRQQAIRSGSATSASNQ